MSALFVPHQLALEGDWAFAYKSELESDDQPRLMPVTEARCAMPVPGFWDDHLVRLKQAGLSDRLRFNPDFEPIRLPMTSSPPDASLPYLMGVGQYEREFDAPSGARLTLECGPVFIESWVWVNGRRVAHQPHYSTTWSVPLDGFVMSGARNRLSLQVANTRPRTLGCITRGYKGYSAGIAGPVRLRVTGPARLADCYVQTADGGETLRWHVDVDRPGEAEGPLELVWRIVDRKTGSAVIGGVESVRRGVNAWATPAADLAPWSDRSPTLYRIELELRDGGALSDVHKQSFGRRWIVTDGFKLRLNDKPLYMRGATEHAYFPHTCTVPLDKRTHRAHLRQLKALGFNWLRFHTWVPPEPYLEAADELGMLVQVEPPAGASDDEWADILRACRRHPSVVIYCAGNEELLDDAKLDRLEGWARQQRAIAPDALFNPQEALRGIEYGWQDEDLGEDAVAEPYLHNPRRLQRLKTFSDCFGQFAWGMLSYRSSQGDHQLIDERLATYERPCLSHEIGIHGSYLDLDLEHRYVDTRIGTALYTEVRQYLRACGLEKRAATYYANSCAWMRRLRKHAIETARRCRSVAGYDLLGAVDHHWHRTGYPCGVMNEFYELKPGELAEDVRRYNGSSVLLVEHGNQWVCTAEETRRMGVAVSLFEDESLASARVEWWLRDRAGLLYSRGAWDVAEVRNGEINELGEIVFVTPNLIQPTALTLEVRLTSEAVCVDNQWPLWVYPAVQKVATGRPMRLEGGLEARWSEVVSRRAGNGEGADVVRVIDSLSVEDVTALERGARMLLLGANPFPSQVMTYQIANAGRAENNLATCIYEHPVTARLPHEGFCDWDFQQMMEGGEAVQLDELGVHVEPVIEVVGSFKHVQRQAALFELCVGQGRLMVCSFRLEPSDAAARYLLHCCLDHVSGDEFAPGNGMAPAQLRALIQQQPVRREWVGTDEGFDERAQLAR